MSNIGTIWRGGLGFSKSPSQTTEGTFTRFDMAYESPWAWLKAEIEEQYVKAKTKGKGGKGGGSKKGC